MNTREIANEYRLDHWTQIMQDRVDSELSVRAYCKNTGIHENTYYYWQRKLREAACSGIQTTESGVKSIVPSGWATLCVSENLAKPQGLTVEVGGCRMTVYSDTDQELLAKVCRALKSL